MNELPPQNRLEAYSSFHCDYCNYEVDPEEKYVRLNEKDEDGKCDFKFVCMRCAKEETTYRPYGVER